MKQHTASHRPLVPWMAAWFLLLGGCSAIEIGSAPLQDRSFEPAQPVSVEVERLPAPPRAQKPDRSVETVPLQASGGVSESQPDSVTINGVLVDLRPVEPDSSALEARHAPAAGGMVSEAVSEDFLRRMNARAQVLHKLQKDPPAEAIDRPDSKTIGNLAADTDSETPPATGIARPGTRGETRKVVTVPREEPQYVSSRVARLPLPVRPESNVVPVPGAGLSVRIGFVDDRVESTAAGQERLEALAPRLRQDARTVRIRALASASTRRPSRARWLALKRLFAVRDNLLAKGVDKATLELDAGVLVDEGREGDRVEISVAPAAEPLRQMAATVGPDPVRRKPSRAAAETVSAAPSPVPRTAPPAQPARAAPRPAAETVPAAPSPVPRTAPPAQPARAAPRPAERAVRTAQVIVVQVGSHKLRPDAVAQVDRFKSSFSDLLGDQDIRITAVDLEGRGRYHRVRTGPFASKADASAFCQSLKQQGQDCLVVRSKRRVQAAARSAQPP